MGGMTTEYESMVTATEPVNAPEGVKFIRLAQENGVTQIVSEQAVTV